MDGDDKPGPEEQQPDKQQPDTDDPILKDAVRATDPTPDKKEPRPVDYPNLGGEVD